MYLLRISDSLGSATPAANNVGRKSRKKRKKNVKVQAEKQYTCNITGDRNRGKKVTAALHYVRDPWWQSLRKIPYEKQ